MIFGNDTIAILEHLDTVVEGRLRKRDDVGVLLELCAQSDNADLFNNTATTGAGLWNVYRTLRRLQPGVEGYKELEREFGNLLNILRVALADVMENADDTTLQRFNDIYFGMTQGVIRNLIDLGHDLAKIKELQGKE